jgi:uncharacterized protein (DUF983 family)
MTFPSEVDIVTRTCKECGEIKPLDKFPKGRYKCKICRNKDSVKYYNKNHKKKPICPDPDKKICSVCNETKYKNEFIKDRNICKSCKKKISRKNYLKDSKSHLESLDQVKTCIKCGKEKKIKDFSISKNMCIKCKTTYTNEKMKNDPAFKIRCNLASRLRSALRSQDVKKQHTTMVLTDCTRAFLKNWFEHQFNSNMTWDNYGLYWHIDHVIPCSSFNLLDEKEQFKCFNWKNLRPCKSMENLSKNNKVDNWQILLQEIRVTRYLKLSDRLEK